MTLALRDYQQKADTDIHAHWAAHPAHNILYVAPCRSGKTVQMAATILKQTEGNIVVIAHRGELIAQMSLTLARNGIYHRVIGPKKLADTCAKRHVKMLGGSFVRADERVAVASVNSLINRDPTDAFFNDTKLWILDECHHGLSKNVFGQSIAMLPNARGLGVTATPSRSDGQGLGRHNDGIFDAMIQGPTMLELKNQGFIAQYKIFAPTSDIDLTTVKITQGGDFSKKELSEVVNKSRIVGDVVSAYLRFAPGKLGITFAVDIENATKIADGYIAAGVSASVISSETNWDERIELQRKHQNREILMLVNVDLFGEGVDIQMLECVVMARPTASRGLYIQQICRPLNPDPLKPHAYVIDLVGNVLRHKLPDAPIVHSLERREKKAKVPDDATPVRICAQCTGVYEATTDVCPYCGYKHVPTSRGSPQAVDGDLAEMSEELLKRLRGEAAYIDKEPNVPYNATPVIYNSIIKRHKERGEAQKSLRRVMSIYGGWQKGKGKPDSVIQRQFFFTFGIDVLSAQGLNRLDSIILENKIVSLLTSKAITTTMYTSDDYRKASNGE